MGPFISAKAGINGGNVANGRKNAVAFNGLPDFGVTMFIPLSEENELGFCTDLALTTYAYTMRGLQFSNEFTMKYSYITLSPSFYFSSFLIGFNFGFPVAADYGAKLDASKLSMMVEFRLGMSLPLISDEDGRLNIIATAGYMLTGVYEDFAKDDPLLTYMPAVPPEKITSEFNPRPISFSLGLNYMFNLRGE